MSGTKAKDHVLEALARPEPAPRLRLHLVGVAGSGMSGLAALLLAQGHRVSGSDKVTTHETERLQGEGLAFYCPHTAEAVAGTDAVILSSAIKPGNPDHDAALRLGIPLLGRAEALAAVMRGRKGIVVAGTHGKTTTSAMAAHVLRGAGLDPSHYVGAEIPILGTNAALGRGEYFVAEADESDGSLVHFHPEHALVLNLEAEHLDFYRDGIAGIERVFRQVLDQTAGRVFYCADDPGARAVCEGRPGAVGAGTGAGNRYRADAISVVGQSSEFTVRRDGEELGRIILNIPGRHNILNAIVVIALALELGVPFASLRESLAAFRGAKRRFEVLLTTPRFRVVDDYGHHPTEVAATLAAARALGPARVLCVFQPHRYSRTRLLAREFGGAFDDADLVFVTDVYAASEAPIPGVSGETIVREVAARGHCRPASTPGLAAAAAAAGNAVREGDLVVTLGAGNVHRVGALLARDLGVLDRLREALGDAPARFRLYEPMSLHTTMRVGGPAQYWIEPESVAAFQRVVRFLREEAIPLRVVGRGSNLLVRDGGIRGAVVHPAGGEFTEVRVEGDRLTAGVGARFKKLASVARSAGLGGFEWMEGIPGNVGGGLRMNAGAMGTQTFDQVESVRCVTSAGELVEWSRDEIDARYRSVPALESTFAVSAVFRGAPAATGEIDARLGASRTKRRESQPIAASAGCVFKNPGPVPAGRLVEELGFKGARRGAAAVSEVHGNFIVNEGGGRASDVLALIEEIRVAARERRGLELETEVQIVGQDAPIIELP